MNQVSPVKAASVPSEVRVAVGSAIYNEIIEFLYREAALLDQVRLDEWAGLLAEDLRYTAPLRVTRTGADQSGSVVRTTKHFDDDYQSIMTRLGRLKTKSAWAEDPPSRTRRLITNVLVTQGEHAGEYEVVSYLFLARSRYEESDYRFISAERRDLLRRNDAGEFKLARREILVDQSVLGVQNFAIFL